MAKRGSTDVFLLLQSYMVIWRTGTSIVGQLTCTYFYFFTQSVNPRFLFIMLVIMIYLFVLDDSFSWRFTTRTDILTQCCEPLQNLKVRLGTGKIDLSPPVIL